MKSNMTNFDINAVVSELTHRFSGSELKNIFEFNDIFYFRFRTKTEGTQLLVIEPGKRIHITNFKRNFPPEPSGLCKAFRIHIKGKWLKNFYQYDFDRICVFEFEAYEKVYTLIVELFGKGNLILISPEKKILVAQNYKKMRDRDIHPGIEFEFPPSSGRNFMEANLDWVREELETSKEKNIQMAISRTVNINKTYSTEICIQSQIEPTTDPKKITKEQIEKVIENIIQLREIITKKELNPTKYLDKKKKLIDIVPFPLKIYEEYSTEHNDSFSELLDKHFSTIESDKVTDVELSAEKRKVQQLVEVRKKQEAHLGSMRKIANAEKERGNLIYMHLQEIDELIETITKARRNNVEWEEIKEKLAEAKKKKMKGARLLDKIKENKKTIVIKIKNKKLELDFLKSATDNANQMYKKAKKSESKIPGAQKKIDELNERIKKLEEGYEKLEQEERIMIVKRKKEWFEKFHWFKSSDGLLVIAGKDLRSNEQIVKKYLEKDDLFLHAEVHGAAVVVIKGDGKPIPESTINEAAIFSVCYSKSWKDGLSAEDTYWVKPDQVSFTPPSGEYLAKGSFIISGEKNQIRNVPLEIGVCPKIQEKNAYVLSGPISALESRDDIIKNKIIKVIPGDITKSKVAKKIVQLFLDGLEKPDREKIKDNALNELISILPGDCYIVE